MLAFDIAVCTRSKLHRLPWTWGVLHSDGGFLLVLGFLYEWVCVLVLKCFLSALLFPKSKLPGWEILGKLVQNLNRVHGSLLNFLGSGTEACSTCSSNYYSYTGFGISLDMFFCMKCHPRFNLLMRQATKSENCCDDRLNSSSSISVGVNDSP
jgi:hypothetical protein